MTIPSTMALAAKLLICLAFFFGGVYCRGIRQSYGPSVARQTCPTGYYCPSEVECKSPRRNRCTLSQDCTGLGGCYEQPDGSYSIRIGHTSLSSSGSSSSSSSKQYRFEHQFVVYRGYAYEFGSGYLQVLDISDPDYRYAGDRGVSFYTFDGTSYCTYNEAVMFVNSWNVKYEYSVFGLWGGKNCQHFAMAFSEYLQTASCNRQGARDLKQNTDDTAMLMEEIDGILSNCSIVCCDDDNSSGGSALVTSVPIVAFAFIYTFFVIFI